MPFWTQKIRALFRKQQHIHQQSLNHTLLEIPVEILLPIFALLPLPSQVCLTLSCKSLYELFGFVLKDERLAWPRLLANKSYEVPLNQPDLQRNQLLLQLENDRWLRCAGCLKIHPHAFFLPDRRSLPPLSRRRCMYESDVVDLCPCLSLTFFDRLRLEKWLHTGLVDTLSQSNRQMFQLLGTKGQQYLLHQCSMVDHADAFINLTMMVTLQENNSLAIQTRYHIYWSTAPHPGAAPPFYMPSDIEPIFLCPHFEILEFLYDLLHWSRPKCVACDSSAHIIGRMDNGRYIVVQGMRNLGGIPHPARLTWLITSRQHWNRNARIWYYLHGEQNGYVAASIPTEDISHRQTS